MNLPTVEEIFRAVLTSRVYEVARETSLDHALAISQRLRGAGLNVETQLEPRKLARQLQYADRSGIRFVVIRGEDEAARGVLSIKDLRRGEQQEVPEAGLIEALRAMRGRASQAVAEQAG